jgi:hypothetical protein
LYMSDNKGIEIESGKLKNKIIRIDEIEDV